MTAGFQFWIYFSTLGLVSCYRQVNPEFPWLRTGMELSKNELEYAKQHITIPDILREHELKGNLYQEITKMRNEAMSIRIEDWILERDQDNLTAACARDFDRYSLELTANDTDADWADMMVDATGWWDPGLLDGNTIYEGRYKLCARAAEDPESGAEYPIQGLYCLGYWWQYYAIIEGFWKRGQGICIPDTCTNTDAKTLLKSVYTKRMPWYAKIDPEMHCERGKPDLSQDPAAIISIVILSLFGVLAVVATLYHHYRVEREDEERPATGSGPEPDTKSTGVVMRSFNTGENGEVKNRNIESVIRSHDDAGKGSDVNEEIQTQFQSQKKPFNSLNKAEQLLMAFSMYVTVPLITTSRQPKGVYKCLNGIRFLAMGWIVLGHTYVLGTMEMPGTVENEFVAYASWGKLIYQKLETIDIYVDTFFILSAFLMSISFLRKLKRTNGKLGVSGWVMHYFGRYWRLTPTYMIVLMIYSNFWHYWGKGPFMRQYVGDVDSCETAWWTNLLYINNLYTGHGWCFGWSWYLCVDWQLYCVAPLFLYALWRKESVGICLTVLGFLSGIVSTRYLKNQVYTQTEEWGDEGYVDDFMDIYIVPWCRCSVYFMGIGLGYLYYKYDGKIKLHWAVVCIGWVVAIVMYLLVSYIPNTGPWTTEGLVAYYTLNRVMWGIWVCWLILACSMGYGGFVNTFLSWKFFVPLAKLTYLGYLIHPILTFLYFYGSPIQQYYYDYFFVYLFAANMMLIHIFSLVMAVTVSAPLMGSIAVFLPSMRGKDRR